MKLNLISVYPEFLSTERGFDIKERDGYRLVTPGRNKMAPSDWPLNERPYRSSIFDSSGKIVSVGMPKFFNAHEALDDTDSLIEQIEAGRPVYFTEKIDGSLCIRSVIDGEVVFRTRGTFDGQADDQSFGDAMRKVAEEKYPVLLEPWFYPHLSLHFEFVSPKFRIVLPYPEDDLIFIGATNHHSLSYTNRGQAEWIAYNSGFRIVDVHVIAGTFDKVASEIEKWEGKEGVVASWQDENRQFRLLKIKAAMYLRQHRLRFALSPRVIREVCIAEKIISPAEFELWLIEAGGDWELMVGVKEIVEHYCELYKLAEKEFELLANEVDQKIIDWPNRKDFAVNYALTLPGYKKSAAFMLLDNKPQQSVFLTVLNGVLDERWNNDENPE